MEVVWSSGFKRSFKKITKKNPQLKNQIINVLRLLADDPFTPSLKSHKLGRELAGLWSCSVAYDCFSFNECSYSSSRYYEVQILMIKLLWCGHLARTKCTSLKLNLLYHDLNPSLELEIEFIVS